MRDGTTCTRAAGLEPREPLIRGAEPSEVAIDALSKPTPGTRGGEGGELRGRAGEVFGLLGPNGAGKSTTVGMLTTTIGPTSGEARLAGFESCGSRSPPGA